MKKEEKEKVKRPVQKKSRSAAHHTENEGENKGLSMMPPPLQFKSMEGQEEEGKKPIQKKSNPNGMPEKVQTKMENAFGQDFSNVNIHTNSNSAKDMGALAYAQGNDVHFASGQYNPESQKGQELLGHELTHVVQQREGRVKPTTQAKGVAVNDDKGLEKEADDMGRKVVQGKMSNTEKKKKKPIQNKSVAQKKCSTCEEQEEEVEGKKPPVEEEKKGDDSLQMRRRRNRRIKYKNCSDEQKGKVQTALDGARITLRNAIVALEQAMAAHPNISSGTKAALETHFHTTKKKHIKKICRKFKKIERKINKKIKFKCHDECKGRMSNAIAYVIPFIGKIHICNNAFNSISADKRISTILHEASHRYTGTGDKAYSFEDGYTSLSAKKAMRNAESYGCFANAVSGKAAC